MRTTTRTAPTTGHKPTHTTVSPTRTAPAPVPHQSDTALAAALFAAWSGDPVTVVSSPPGAGKTRLITHLAHQLATRAGMRVAIAAQTRAQALDVANRVAATGARTALVMPRTTSKSPARVPGMHPDLTPLYGAGLGRRDGVVVATTAAWQWLDDRTWTADILLVDEAYQMTYADLGSLGTITTQLVLVGDPGQIAPVITGDTSRWTSDPTGPHQRAPQALAAAYGDHVTHQRLPHTWRLGPHTTALIQPALYPDLPFTSARPDRHLTHHGHQLPEITHTPLTITGGPTDPHLAAAAADHVRTLLTGPTIITDHHATTRALTSADIAVVVPHVAQAALIAAHLANHPDVLIGTANALQGLERDAVIVVHPSPDTPPPPTSPPTPAASA